MADDSASDSGSSTHSNERTIAEDIVLTKYKAAGDIVNRALKAVVALCIEGGSVKEICIKGDELIVEETDKIFKKDTKGIAFPTCLSVNNCVCHFSPTKNDADYTLKSEDVVKIDLGVHIDGFIAVAAHTVVIGATKENKITGRKADVVLAAYWAGQAALRLLKPGNKNNQITETVQKIADAYKCKPIEGMLSHQLKQSKIDGDKTIIQNPNDAQKKEHEECEFGLYEVYAMDVLISTGVGIGKEQDTKVAIFQRTEENYQLKLKASRVFYAEVKNKYPSMPFNLRYFEEETKARMGVVECVSHKLIDPFQVLYEKSNEVVAQFKYTVLLTPNRTSIITGLPFDTSSFKSENSITDAEIKAVLASGYNIASDSTTAPVKKSKPKKKKAKKPAPPTH